MQRLLRSAGPLSRALRVPLICPRWFAESVSSEGSHSDFQPKHKIATEEVPEIHKYLRELVTKNKVMLFMKGTPSIPQCGFSYKVSELLKKEGVDFASANILTSPRVAVALKSFSDWQTFPQLFVDGQFVGGCDVVSEMFDSGELRTLFLEHHCYPPGEEPPPSPPATESPRE